MRIHEVRNSTQTWATLKGIELELSEEFLLRYRQTIQMLKVASKLKTSPQWSSIKSNILMILDRFLQLANDYISGAQSLGITDDKDLNSRINKVRKMQENLKNLYQSLN